MPADDDEVLEGVVRNCCWEYDAVEDSGIAAGGSGCSVAVENHSSLAWASLDTSQRQATSRCDPSRTYYAEVAVARRLAEHTEVCSYKSAAAALDENLGANLDASSSELLLYQDWDSCWEAEIVHRIPVAQEDTWASAGCSGRVYSAGGQRILPGTTHEPS